MNIEQIHSKRYLHLRTKDMKDVVQSDLWREMHEDAVLSSCDYPNHNCLRTREITCEECGAFRGKGNFHL